MDTTNTIRTGSTSPLRLSPAQLTFCRGLLADGDSQRPWGYPTAGRDTANWLRTVAALERLGLVVAHRHHSHHGAEFLASVSLALPVPAWIASLTEARS